MSACAPVSPSALTQSLLLAFGLAFFSMGCSPKTDVVAAPAVPATTVGMEIDDTVVTTRVKTALLADPEVKSSEIAVVTRKGEVQLSGFVATQAQIDHAVGVARGVEGVQAVLNQIAIQK